MSRSAKRTVGIDEALYNDLEEMAKRMGISVQECVRRSVCRSLGDGADSITYGPKKTISFAGHSIGIIIPAEVREVYGITVGEYYYVELKKPKE